RGDQRRMMSQKARILALGDPGPVRHALLLREDVQTLWTSRVEEMAAVLQHAEPDVCLISAAIPPRQVEAAPQLLEGTASDEPTPSIVLRKTMRTEAILAQIGKHTGVRFAKDARAKIEALARVYIDTEEHVLETSNISASGVAIRNFPRMALDTQVLVEV